MLKIYIPSQVPSSIICVQTKQVTCIANLVTLVNVWLVLVLKTGLDRLVRPIESRTSAWPDTVSLKKLEILKKWLKSETRWFNWISRFDWTSYEPIQLFPKLTTFYLFLCLPWPKSHLFKKKKKKKISSALKK